MRVLSYAAAAAFVSAISGIAIAQESAKASSNAEFMLKNYPPESLKRGEQGKVGFELTIDQEGRASECLVTQSSGFATLDDGTCEFMVRYVHVAPAKAADGTAVKSTKAGYITWKLPPNVTPAAVPVGQAPLKSERLICKLAPVSGSIIKKVRRCMSEAQWKTNDSRTLEAIDQSTGAVYCGDHGC